MSGRLTAQDAAALTCEDLERFRHELRTTRFAHETQPADPNSPLRRLIAELERATDDELRAALLFIVEQRP